MEVLYARRHADHQTVLDRNQHHVPRITEKSAELYLIYGVVEHLRREPVEALHVRCRQRLNEHSVSFLR